MSINVIAERMGEDLMAFEDVDLDVLFQVRKQPPMTESHRVQSLVAESVSGYSKVNCN